MSYLQAYRSIRRNRPDNIILFEAPDMHDSEMIRDNILFSSGLLRAELGGPSVKPYQPEGLWEAIASGPGRGETTISLIRVTNYTEGACTRIGENDSTAVHVDF